MLKKLLFITLSIMILIGCTKERADEFAQGQGQQDLWTISQFQNKYFIVETGGALIEKKATNADELELATGDESYTELNNFDLVSYTTDSTLLKDVPFRAKKYTTYQVRYVVTKDYLKVMKVAKKELLPSQEQVIAKQIPGTQLWEVPLIGYPITLKKVEQIEDANGDKTSKLQEYGTSALAGASHFKINITDRKLFDADEKNDIFPINLFGEIEDDEDSDNKDNIKLGEEWFYAATIISTNAENSDKIGRDLSVDSEQAYVSRIQFIRTVNSVIGKNVNMDEGIDSDEINAKAALEIPIEWVDYKIATIGKDSALTEEEVGDDHLEAKHWKKRKYMKIDFAKTKAGFGVNDDNEVLNPKFENLEITANYISFTIYYPDSGVKVKYALKKAETPKKGRIYFKDDRTKFGFFKTSKRFINSYEYYYQDDFDKQVLINRFYPGENGKIEYHFTHETPEEFRPVVQKAVDGWNEIFKKAGNKDDGTAYEIVLNKEEDVDLGDLRYNIINILDTQNGARLLGYGPSIADTKSGEIVSATTNVYINPFRDGLASKLRQYIRYRLGMFTAEQINGISDMTATSSNIPAMLLFYKNIKQDSDLGSVDQKNDLDLSKAFFEESNKKQIASYHEHQKQISENQTEREFNEKRFGDKCSFQVHSNDVIKRIETYCSGEGEFLEYVEELVAQNVTHDHRELTMINSCIEKLIEDELLSTLVHEMGHNFGLRHNFSASNDPANFYPESETGGVLVKTASTMDYNNGQSYELLKPGLYDLAAIRFGYAQTIETDSDGNDQFIKLDINKSIESNISDYNTKENVSVALHKFNYCSDEHVGDKDPLCNRWDYGENPLEVVDSIINFYHSLYATEGHRRDKARGPLQAEFNNKVIEKVLIPLKQIYEHWRYLLTNYVQDKNKHLEMYSIKEYEEELGNMEDDTGKHGQNFAQYYQASEKAYQFLKSLVTMTARYCVTKSLDNSVTLLNYHDFETVRTDIYKLSSVTVFDCDDNDTHAYFQNKNQELVTTVGSYFNEVSQSLNPYVDVDTYRIYGQREERLQITGTSTIKDLAMHILALREPMLKLGMKVSNNTNFLDDPRYREEMIDFLVVQAIHGTSTKHLNASDKIERYLPLFKREQEVKQGTFMRLLTGLAVPSNNSTTLERWELFKPQISSPSYASNIPAIAAQVQFDSAVYYATPNREYAFDMINRYNWLANLEDKKNQKIIPTQKDLQALYNGEISLINPDQFKKITLKQFMDAAITIKNQVNALEDGNQKRFISEILKDELELATYLEGIKDQLTEYMQYNAVDFITQALQIPVKAIGSTIDKRVTMFIKDQHKILVQIKDYKANEHEYKAQTDMLRNIVQSMAK